MLVGEEIELGVHQDLDQSPEEPKASVSVESEEGKPRIHLTLFLNSYLYFSYLCYDLCI